ncbi:folate-binding protein YgfZ [Patulibacter sp. SYSU D01012]|uniref:CAF17-like 4Fe-4S cluster assembly/insertion protein YgfZ n=1 Tax=Patulibacter sp. SYSU D01012 TaxID=2817381 RepID=UPI001B304B30|nr:folate-binding protein YgfZ [Patulibacter sp. SYSU D01012]
MLDLPQDPVPATGPDPERLAREHAQASTGAALVDRSAAGKLALTGAEARAFLTGQVTADVEALTPGHGTYAALLTPKGKIVADLRILALPGAGEDDGELLLLCERSGLQALFDHLRRHLIGYAAELHKRTLQTGLLSLAGPRALGVLDGAARELPGDEHAAVRAEIDGVPALLVRTDVGVDLLPDAARTDELRAALEARGAVAVSEEALEILRVERGRPRLHHEMDEGVMPAEVGIVERAVSFTKGCYVGQETVARLHWRGRPNRHLRGLELDRPVPVGSPILEDGRELGRVTTSVVSPVRGPIALALVRREVEPGATVVLRPAEGGPTTARVVALPFGPADGSDGDGPAPVTA